jgi:PmbA protein
MNGKMLNAAIELEKLLFNCDERIKKHAGCSIRSDFRSAYVLNSLGLDIAASNNFFRTEITAIIEEAGEQYDCTTFSMANSLEGLKLKEIARKAAFMAALKIDAIQPSSGTYNLLISNEVALKMMITLWQLFSASNILTGKSILKDMLNKKIGSNTLNIIDSPVHPLSGYSFEFDCEGTKAKEKLLVSNGIFKSILSNNSLAADFGMDSSGNAGWCDTMGNIYPSQLTVTPMNIYINPGNKSEDNIMCDMEEGLYIAYVGDYYHSIDITSGNISMPCDGALINKGKLSQNVKQMTLSCNILDLFNNIQEVGNDLIFDEFDKRSYCIGSPCLLVRDMYISSK